MHCIRAYVALQYHCNFTFFVLTADRDYVPIIEIVKFLPQEVEKSVSIFIVDDKNIENFFLYLTSGEGVHLSPFSTTEVVIKNDDGKDIPTKLYYTCILNYIGCNLLKTL